jgi:hypothetical protein
MRRAQLIIAGVVALTGMVVGCIGWAAFVSGAAVAEQTGQQGAMGTGVMLVLLGLFLAVTPAGWVISRAIKVYGPGRHRMSQGAQFAALSGLAVGGYAANRVWADRIRDRYDATDAAATGGAGQPEVSAPSTGQPGSGIDPTPAMWEPHGE